MGSVHVQYIWDIYNRGPFRGSVRELAGLAVGCNSVGFSGEGVDDGR